MARRTEFQIQQAIVAGLKKNRAFPAAVRAVRLVETHISWVLLAGRYAYKIKKAVNLGFLDFRGLETRRRFCEEEVRLNQRLAPSIYLGIVPIGGDPDHPQVGCEPAIEFAVRMRRFAMGKQLDRLLGQDHVSPEVIDKLAAVIAAFHNDIPQASPDSEFGTPAVILDAVEQSLGHLRSLLDVRFDNVLTRLEANVRSTFAMCERFFLQRREQGWVRECHGDLHLGNIVLMGDRPVPFDCIEFNPEFRWIDVMNEVAFLVMDLEYRNRQDLAYRFVNDWLELTGDYEGVTVLRFYLAYRALVRAKVNAIRAAQINRGKEDAYAICSVYLDLANRYFVRRPSLVITHGLPGSGKTTFALEAAGRLQGIRIRSDVERKRLFGLSPLEISHSIGGGGIYSKEATRQTYTRLLELASVVVRSGFTAIVDAAFLRLEEREAFRALARKLDVPFVIVSLRADKAVLRSRIAARQLDAQDASEADTEVLDMLESAQEMLTPEEQCFTVPMFGDGDGRGEIDLWRRLGTMLDAPGFERE